MRWIYNKVKVKFKDGLYTLTSDVTQGPSIHEGVAAWPGWVWKKMEITKVEFPDKSCHDWKLVFIFWPVKSVSGQRLFWQRAYRRKCVAIWNDGLHQDSITQYATLFDIMKQPV